jgi:hypothetical protein
MIAFALAGIELVYNMYPPRSWSSLLLFVEHLGIVAWLLYRNQINKRENSKQK